MGLTSHLSDAYNAFSSSCFSFSSILSPMTISPTNQKKKSTKKIKRRKHRKDDSSDPSSSDDSDSSDDSHYRRKRHNNKKHRKKDPIRLCATLTSKLLTTPYKWKIIRFKMDEDPLQRRIYFLTFIDLLDMIFSQYTETCEVLLRKKAIRNLLHSKINVHSRRFIAEFSKGIIKCIEKLQ